MRRNVTREGSRASPSCTNETGTCADRRAHHIRFPHRRDCDDIDRNLRGEDAPGQFESVAVGQIHVEQYEIDRRAPQRAGSIRYITGAIFFVVNLGTLLKVVRGVDIFSLMKYSGANICLSWEPRLRRRHSSALSPRWSTSESRSRWSD